MFVCYNYAPIISCTFVLKLMKAQLDKKKKKTILLWETFNVFRAQYSVKFLGKTKVDFWRNGQ